MNEVGRRLLRRNVATSSSEDDRGYPFYLFFASIWLVYLLEPISAAWRQRSTMHGAAGLAATLLFAGVYLWHFARSRRFAWARPEEVVTGPSPLFPRVVRYAALAGLALASTVALGQSGTTTWVFLAVAGLWTFPAWVAVGLAAALAAAYELLAYQLPSWDRDGGVSLSIFLSVLAVGGAMMAARRSRDLSAARRENARLMVEEERNRMARDLHDILGHSLTVITVKAELASRLIDVDPARARAEVEDLERLTREALSDVRHAVQGFREISLAGELARAREALVSAGIEARLPRTVDLVPADLREVYAWVVREGVTNVIRHSAARTCTVSFDAAGLRLADDGGAREPAGPPGNGLRGLRERASAAGVVLTTATRPTGFELSLVVPPVAGLTGAHRGDAASPEPISRSVPSPRPYPSAASAASLASVSSAPPATVVRS